MIPLALTLIVVGCMLAAVALDEFGAAKTWRGDP